MLLDGRLDEPMWQQTEPASHFVQKRPNNDHRDTTGGQLVERAFIVKVTHLFNF